MGCWKDQKEIPMRSDELMNDECSMMSNTRLWLITCERCREVRLEANYVRLRLKKERFCIMTRGVGGYSLDAREREREREREKKIEKKKRRDLQSHSLWSGLWICL